MSGAPSQRWIFAGGFAVAGAHLVVALIEAMTSHTGMAVALAFTAVMVAGPLAVVSRLVIPPHQEGGPSAGGDGGSGPSDGGDDDSTPPWWPEFERALRAHVRAREEAERSPERGTPAPA